MKRLVPTGSYVHIKPLSSGDCLPDDCSERIPAKGLIVAVGPFAGNSKDPDYGYAQLWDKTPVTVYYDPSGCYKIGELHVVEEYKLVTVELDEAVFAAAAGERPTECDACDCDGFAEEDDDDTVVDYPEPTFDQEYIFSEVVKERQYQDGLWGGSEADDKQCEEDWESYIYEYASGTGRAAKYRHDFRTRMLKVAALAFAAIESFDRLEELAATAA